jgi:tetratricopeptide (TPR) repeat protein
MKYLLPILLLVGCSSTPDKKEPKASDITNASFNKPAALKNNEVTDFYQGNTKTLTPALQDETVDRYTPSELSKIKNSGDPLLEIAIRCSLKKYDEAFDLASKIFDRYQKVAAYWNQVANCHLNSGAHRKALLFYNKALEVDRNYVPALNNIGVMYERQNQDQKALVAFERASKVGKFSKTPRYNLGKLYLTYGLTDSAIPVIQGLLNETPQDIDLLNIMGTAQFLEGNYQAALSYYDKIPQKEWGNPEIGLNLSWTLKKANRGKDALKVFDMVSKPTTRELKKYYSVVEGQLGELK